MTLADPAARPRPPVVTLILIGANLLAAFALLVNPDLAYEFGFRPDHPTLRGAVTSLFLHANVIHLLGNMVFLAAVGAAVEMATGSFRFASVYFLSGLVGVAAHYLMTRHMDEPAPFIGASGCIAGCVAYYTFRYQAMRVPLAPRVAVSVLAVTGIWLALQVVGSFVHLGESGGISFWAHLGGFLTGIVLSVVFRAPDLGLARLGHEAIAKMEERGPAAVQAMALKHLERHPGDPKALWELARASEAMGDASGEQSALATLVDVGSEGERVEAVRRLLDLGRACEIPVLRRFKLADALRTEDPETSRRLLQSVLDDPDESRRPEALLALAEVEREAAPDRCAALLDELERLYPLHPATEVARKRGWRS